MIRSKVTLIIARVIGNLIATIKTPSHENFKIMVVAPIGLDGKSNQKSLLAIDQVQAGIGDAVLIIREGNSCRQLTGRKDGAIDAVIVGFIDYIDTKNGRIRLN